MENKNGLGQNQLRMFTVGGVIYPLLCNLLVELIRELDNERVYIVDHADFEESYLQQKVLNVVWVWCEEKSFPVNPDKTETLLL